MDEPTVECQKVTMNGVIQLNFNNLMSVPSVRQIDESPDNLRFLQE